MYAFVFPGQGSQSTGMGKELYNTFSIARDVFHEVDDALGQHLSRLIFEGEKEELDLTENTQPALMAVSLAVARVLENEGGFRIADKAALVAGHSLGEYSAIAVIGGFRLGDAARLLKTRGKAMQKAVPAGMGGMVAVLGVSLEQAQDLANHVSQGEVCAIANDNSAGQVVLSGHREAIARAVAAARDFGAVRAVSLPVSAPFHCELMSSAARVMKDALWETPMQDLDIPLIANVTAEAVQKQDEIRGLLVDQVCGRVRWRESVSGFAQRGVHKIIELGAGRVLAGLAKRIDPHLDAFSLCSPLEIEQFLKTFGESTS